MKQNFRIEPSLLPALAAFECIARHASFSRAAGELGVSASALSQTLRGLEDRLGVRLLQRTTRRVGLTDEGAHVLDGVRNGMAAFSGALNALEIQRNQPGGTVRITLPICAFNELFVPHLASFAERYPRINVEFWVDSTLTDIVASGFDCGVRMVSGIEADMVAVPIGPPQKLVIVGTPEYFSRRPPPRTPDELAEHVCSDFRFVSSSRLAGWTLQRNGEPLEIPLKGRFISNDLIAELEMVRSGLLIAQTLESLVIDDLRAGRLVSVLDDYARSLPAFHLYFPSRSQMPPRLRAFIDHFQQANAPVRDRGSAEALR